MFSALNDSQKHFLSAMSDGPENNSSPPGKDLALPLLLPGRPRVHPRPGRTFFLGNDPLGSGHTKKNGVKLIVLGLGRPFLSTVVNAGLITLVSPSETGLARSMLMSRLVGRGEMIEAFKNGSSVYPDKLNEVVQSTRY